MNVKLLEGIPSSKRSNVAEAFYAGSRGTEKSTGSLPAAYAAVWHCESPPSLCAYALTQPSQSASSAVCQMRDSIFAAALAVGAVHTFVIALSAAVA